MNRILRFILPLCLILPLVGFAPRFLVDEAPQGYPMRLSEYHFFEGDIAAQQAGAGVMPYALNTPLFSDYAEKLRFVKLPPGTQVAYNGTHVLDFPEGTQIIKTFYYPHDARKPEKGRRLMETRLLIREATGWKALAYHWNDAQTDALLEVAGGEKEVSWIDKAGKKQKLLYSFPNLNQCKGCHSYDGAMQPIGPSARQLNGDFAYASGTQNQLLAWGQAGMIGSLPEQLADVPKIAVWNDPATGTLDQRARAWLDINCAHCHNPHGPASTSGFYLDIRQTNPAVLGVRKSPVAAGRGAGEGRYDIEPGKPETSILYIRIASTDPGVMMPEVGRRLVHQESLDLIRSWIAEMK
ncbi:MAG: hypothetical protein EAZ89_01800 [Bacteroidetes bacterium]|nr:MAG: hypothetical protein EAZ89_01800 [Bacteroidota bacterium]